MSIFQNPAQRVLALFALIVCAVALGSLTGALHWLGDMLAIAADYYVVLLGLLLAGRLRSSAGTRGRRSRAGANCTAIQMADITAVAAQTSGPLIVAGDFNAAPWSYVLRDLAAQAEVSHVWPAFDWTKTWRPLPFFGLPVDHILLSETWQVHNYRYGQPGGSDHAPVLIDLFLPS